MASKPKSSGRCMLTAAMPTSLDDLRLLDVSDVVKAVDEMEVATSSPTRSAQPKSLEDIRDMAWAKHNAKPGQKAEATSRSRPAKQPKTLDDLQASAWQRFNNPGRSQTQGER